MYLTRFDVLAFQSSIQFEPGFNAVSLLHPSTYLNKVLVASSQGSMQLWNIRTQFVLSCLSFILVLIVPLEPVSTSIQPQIS
jgi:U3 small nucleolar RNA-associated protein 21